MVREITQIERAQAVLTSRAGQSQTTPNAEQSFDAVLRQRLEHGPGLTFSKHAMERVEERGIEVTPHLIERLSDSVARAEAKGATNILALERSMAFIINVPNGRVITTMSQDEMKDNIFTNIDGAVFL